MNEFILKKKEQVTNSLKEMDNVTRLLMFLWSIGVLTLLTILFQLLVLGKKELWAAFAILISAFIASITVIKSIKHSDEQKEIDMEINDSKFYLEHIIKGLDTVYSLLKDDNKKEPNLDRIVWIEAARTLENILNICEKVTIKSHRKVLKIQLMHYRHLIRQLFIYGPMNKSLPVSFFCGIVDWINYPVDNQQKFNEVKSGRTEKLIETRSLMTIINFTKFPANYSDPLKSTKIKDLLEIDIDEYFRGLDYADGVKEYIKFKENS